MGVDGYFEDWGGGGGVSDSRFGKIGGHPGSHSLTLLLDMIFWGKTVGKQILAVKKNK